MRAAYHHYVDIEESPITVERWAQANNFFVECDIWVPLQFKHFFDPSKIMHMAPVDKFPRGFFFRVVGIQGDFVTEIIHLPGGLVLKETVQLGLKL